MAVVGHPTALFSFSLSGKGTDNGLGALSGSMSQPLINLDLLCTHLALIFVLSKIILVIGITLFCVHSVSRHRSQVEFYYLVDDFHNLILPYLPIFVPLDADMVSYFSPLVVIRSRLLVGGLYTEYCPLSFCPHFHEAIALLC